jgi:undecaprenyl-phosphate 4-deoxy-4-formamido-L-arabinose transferase
MNEIKPSISIVVPVYYSEKTLPELVNRLRVVLPQISSVYEILLVDDCSGDGSWRIIEELAAAYPEVRGINLMRNFGQHNALLAGIRDAKFELSVTIDDDLQHDPESIPTMLARLNEGFDVVYGSPKEERHGLWRDMASVLTKATLATVMSASSARHVSAFRIFYTNLRDAFKHYTGPAVSIDVLLTWGTSRISYVEVGHNKRKVGESHYTFAKLVTHAFNLITGFSTIPLRLATGAGFACVIFGVGIFLYVMIRYLIQGGAVPGFTFLASVISIFSGVQLFALGIMGEYLARMHFRLMDKPTYVVKSETVKKE